MIRPVLGAAAACIVLAGCATVPLPAEELEQTQATIRSAEVLGAESVPTAKLHLQYAKDEQATAKNLAARGDERALTLLSCAQADADLALVLARESQVRRQAVQAAEQVGTLRQRGAKP